MNPPHDAPTHEQRDAEDALLADWCARLADELEVHGLTVDLKAVLGLAGRAAHAVMRPAAPLTTFVVGYAAGMAAAGGEPSDAAVERAIGVALRLSKAEQTAATDS
jgi:hypothetical protein